MIPKFKIGDTVKNRINEVNEGEIKIVGKIKEIKNCTTDYWYSGDWDIENENWYKKLDKEDKELFQRSFFAEGNLCLINRPQA